MYALNSNKASFTIYDAIYYEIMYMASPNTRG